MKPTIEDIQVKIKLLQDERTLAQAELIIGSVIEIKGWRVSVSKNLHSKFQENIWIQPPSYRTSYGYKPMVFISDKKLYGQVEEKIYDAFNKKRIEQNIEDSEVTIPSHDVADDIPF